MEKCFPVDGKTPLNWYLNIISLMGNYLLIGKYRCKIEQHVYHSILIFLTILRKKLSAKIVVCPVKDIYSVMSLVRTWMVYNYVIVRIGHFLYLCIRTIRTVSGTYVYGQYELFPVPMYTDNTNCFRYLRIRTIRTVSDTYVYGQYELFPVPMYTDNTNCFRYLCIRTIRTVSGTYVYGQYELFPIPMYTDTLQFPKQALVFTCLLYKSFENNVGKREIARNEQFPVFPKCFLTRLENVLPFRSKWKLSSANSFSLEKSKICRLGTG